MAISASLSLWGMYQYDHTILDGLTVPTGMDAGTVKDTLLLETSSMSILYPDPNFLKKAVQLWSSERLDVWTKLYATTVLVYNPIENYDRIEETDEVSSGNSSDSRSHSRTSSDQTSEVSSETLSGQTSGTTGEISDENVTGSSSGSRANDSQTTTSGTTSKSGESTSTASNTAYNSDTFKDTAKNISSGSDQSVNDSVSSTSGSDTDSTSSSELRSGTKSGTSTGTSSGSSTGNRSGLRNGSEDLSEQGTLSRSDLRNLRSRVHGNIGVTSAQQMIMQEREVAEFCMVDYIVNDFISRFCVMVY